MSAKAAKMKVTCVINLRNQDNGLPDGGFFTADQIRRKATPDDVFDQLPSRGAMELKSTADDVLAIAVQWRFVELPESVRRAAAVSSITTTGSVTFR